MPSRSNLKEFIEKCSKKYEDNDFDYSESVYVNNKTPILIKSKKFGIIYKNPHDILLGVLNSSYSRYKKEKKREKENKFYEEKLKKEIKKKYGDKYSMDKFIYSGRHNNSIVICKIHGEFKATPGNLLQGAECPFCSNRHNYTTEEWVAMAKKIEPDYIYDKVDYKNNKEKILIGCPKHGYFSVTPHNFLNGSRCPKCNGSKMEKFVEKCLKDKKINFEYQKHFEWLGHKSLDFYFPTIKTAIECQGEQHFVPVLFHSGNKDEERKTFDKIQHDDIEKYNLCLKNDVKLIYFSDKEFFTRKNKINVTESFYSDKIVLKTSEQLKNYIKEELFIND